MGAKVAGGRTAAAAQASRVAAVVFCGDCGGRHSVQVPCPDGDLPSSFAIFAGEGAGWIYRLSGEDRGKSDGLSVPVYRAARELP